jgi:hypothetical protein
LAAEAAERGARISYFSSVEEFAKKHATRIAFITKEWLEGQINADLLLDSLRDDIVEAAWVSPPLGRYLGEEDNEVESVTGSLEVQDFFVYDMGSDEFRVQANWYGHAEVEQTVRVRERQLTGAREYDPASGDYHPTYENVWHSQTRTVDVRVAVVTSIVVEEGTVADYFVADKWVERD